MMGRPPKDSTLGTTQQLLDLMSSLSKSGASQYFLEIRRRAPGVKDHDKLWERWKFNLPADDVEDIRDFCYSAGGDYWEYKVWVKDGSGNPVKGPDQKPMGPYIIPAAAAPPIIDAVAGKVPMDPDLAERAAQLKRQRAEMDLQRQEAQLERDRRRYEKMVNGEDDTDKDDDDRDDWVQHPVTGGWYPKGSPYLMMGMNGGMNPFMLQQQKPSETVELAKAFAPVIAAMIANRPKTEPLSIVDVLKLVTPMLDKGKDSGWSPKDMVSFIGPLMAEVTKSTGDVNKLAMERMADSDKFWKQKLLEAMKLSGAEDDDIDRWRKIFELGTETLKEGTKLIFGRPTILKRGESDDGSVDVPVIEKAKTPGLPDGTKGKPAGPDPAAEAKKVVKERVDAFLAAHEQEMLIGSDAALVAEKLDELYAMLPLPLRTKIEFSDTATIYDALHEISGELVDRILKAVADDTTGARKDHCESFWVAIKEGPFDDDDEVNPDDEKPGEKGEAGNS
jgi:hypothetical protein